LGGRAVGADAILDGDAAALVPAERRVNQAMVVAHVAMNDGKVFLLDGAGFPDFSQLAGGFGIFGDEDDAAGFAVEAVDEVGRNGNHLAPALSPASGGEGEIQMKPGAADEAGKFIALGGMTDEAGRFVDDQQVRVFVEDG
jgi:hypothetical protein